MSDRGVEDVDLLVIGGGKAGKSLAMDRAKAGWKVAMVERDKIGGTCINVACIPTKALVGSARTVLMARHAEVMGVELGDQPLVSVDGLRRHKSSVVDGMVAAHKKMFADSGMDFILRVARFIAPRTVEVETRDEPIRLLRGTDVVINTATTPAIPDLAGITESRVWTSETIFQLERLPQRLIVLGGGYDGHMEGGRGRRHRPNPWCGAARPQCRRGHFHTADGYARRASVPAGRHQQLLASATTC